MYARKKAVCPENTPGSGNVCNSSASSAGPPVPEAPFVLRIDRLLEKDNPDKTIPWPGNEVPQWAENFQPRVVLDIGAGAGGFLRSWLTRMRAWGGLRRLRSLVVFEQAESIVPQGGSGLATRLYGIMREGVGREAGEDLEYLPLIKRVELRAGEDADIPQLEPFRGADLIVASHVTYYFADGSGRTFLRSLLPYLAEGGRIWCVIRTHSCPIYHTRTVLLNCLGIEDKKAFDYAEYFEQSVLPDIPELRLVASAGKAYLDDYNAPGRREAAYLLMWREKPSMNFLRRKTPSPLPQHAAGEVPPVTGGAQFKCDAVDHVLRHRGPLFGERHFILEKRTTL